MYWASFSPDGWLVATVSKDKSIGIWDVQSGRRQRWLVGHAGEVYYAAFTPTGDQLVSGGQVTAYSGGMSSLTPYCKRPAASSNAIQ